MNEITLASILSLGIIQLLAVMSPGPDFALVVLNSIRYHRKKALVTVAGIIAGNIVHLTYCVLGLVIIIIGIPVLFNGIKLAGSLYLIYLGIASILSFVKNGKVSTEKRSTHARDISYRSAFMNGFATNILNVKCALYYAALFSQYISRTLSPAGQSVYIMELLLIAALWFSGVALIMTKSSVKVGFLKYRRWVDLALGVIICIFGLFVMYETIDSVL